MSNVCNEVLQLTLVRLENKVYPTVYIRNYETVLLDR